MQTAQQLTLEAWRLLLEMAHATRSTLIEPHRNGKAEIVGFGFAVFVKKGFADTEVQNPRPGLNSRIIESVLGSDFVIATYEKVRGANTRSDLQQVVLDTSWKHGHLGAAHVDEVRILLARCYQEVYAGYRFSRILSSFRQLIILGGRTLGRSQSRFKIVLNRR